MCVLIQVLYKRSKIDDSELKAFSDTYGTCFSQFKSKEVSCLLHYCLFTLRRTGLVLLVLYCPNSYLSLVLSYTFSITMLIYIIARMPFENFIYNIYHVLNEVLVSAVHVTIFFHFITDFNINEGDFTDICIDFISAAWVINMTCSILAPSYEAVLKFIRKRKSARSRVFNLLIVIWIVIQKVVDR